MADTVPIVNRTIAAVVTIILLALCVTTIGWLMFYGVPANSLHASALSWSYTTIMVCIAALGLDVTVATLLQKK
jgi:hypothetical protein